MEVDNVDSDRTIGGRKKQKILRYFDLMAAERDEGKSERHHTLDQTN